MEKEKVLALLKSPKEFEINALHSINAVLEKHPYFQPMMAVKLKLLHHLGSFQYNKFLKTTAAFTQDRSVLFDFITQKEFQQLKIAHRIDSLIQEDQNTAQTHEFNINENLAEQIHDPELFVKKEETVKRESNFEAGRPLSFNTAEEHSFHEWLKLTQVNPLHKKGDKDNKEEARDSHPQFKVIDEFIKNNPKIVPTKSYEPSEKINPKHEPSSSLMTETLARVYIEQKRYDKAIQAFKILILNNPEKSSFFADQIEEIERLKENK